MLEIHSICYHCGKKEDNMTAKMNFLYCNHLKNKRAKTATYCKSREKKVYSSPSVLTQGNGD